MASHNIISLFSGLLGVVIGLWFNRHQKHRELFYAKKIEAYSSIVEALSDLSIAHAHRRPDILAYFDRFIAALNKAHLFMSEALYKDLKARTSTALIRFNYVPELLHGAAEIHRTLEEIVETDASTNKPLEGDRKERLYCEVLEPLIREIPEIVGLLKRDIGVQEVDGRFYKKKSPP